MKKVLFIDRDGTLIAEPRDTFQIDSFERLRFIPGSIYWLGKIARELDYELVMVTNQDGLGTRSFPEKKFWPVQDFVVNTLKGEGIHFRKILIDKSFAHEHKPTRKPGTGLLKSYLNGKYNLHDSYVIGDRLTDVELAFNLNAKAILIKNNDKPSRSKFPIALVTKDWEAIYHYLKQPPREIKHTRKTNETDITVTLCLDGTGKAKVNTGLGFFDHMLEQIARHSMCDLTVVCKGDLHIDEHHTIEDIAIALGEAFTRALGNKSGIERYGFSLPMDDCLAQVAIDFGGRNWIEWSAVFKRERIGEMPTELFFHFFKSFSDTAKCNLNIKAEGENEHHKIEAIFKAFARCIKMAVKRDGSNQLPTTKGIL